METIRNRISVKIVLFLTVLAVSFVTFPGVFVFAANMSLGSYDKTENMIQKELSWRIAGEAGFQLMEKTGLYHVDEYDTSLKEVKNSVPQKGVFSGEKKATKFGYAIYPMKNKKADKKSPLYILNKDLSKRTNDENVTVYIEKQRTYQVELYLENPEKVLGAYKSGEIPDELRVSYDEWLQIYEYRNIAIAVMIGGTLVMLALGILLMVATRRDVRFVKYVPLDLLAVCTVPVVKYMPYGISNVMGGSSFRLEFLVASVIGTGIVGVIGGVLLILAARMKQKGWWKSTVIYQVCHLIKKIGVTIYREFLCKLSSMWMAALFALAVALINLFVLALGLNMPILLILETIFIFVGILVFASRFKRLLEGGRRIAGGEYDYVISTDGLIFDMKKHAEDLNSIRQGLEAAVKEQTKSERMRNELITNVSHDIKTPLTSIINYVDLLKKELVGSDDETVKEYLDVLDRQSYKLKHLTEDLVEASKAATGNVKMHLAQCDVGMLLSQVAGEYAESAQSTGLEVITKVPEQSVSLLLDGQSMYRVLSNLMGNICKYAQPGTRVYQSLEETEDKIILTFRNTSKYALNISADELMERFVRGDSSRHTEGSGLGLNIASNLVELQGGKFDLYVDGDLFKVVIVFEK